ANHFLEFQECSSRVVSGWKDNRFRVERGRPAAGLAGECRRWIFAAAGTDPAESEHLWTGMGARFENHLRGAWESQSATIQCCHQRKSSTRWRPFRWFCFYPSSFARCQTCGRLLEPPALAWNMAAFDGQIIRTKDGVD